MTYRTAALRGLLIISLATVAQIRAQIMVTVGFTATIEQSPFAAPGYTIGSVINGWYSFDPAEVPIDSGANYTSYNMPALHLTLGAASYASGSSRLDLVHLLPEHISNAVDNYDLFGFSLTGPALGSFSPAFAELKMTDTDNSVYAITPPLPITLPDPSLFEIKTLKIGFLQGPPLVSQEINARIDSIGVVGTSTPVADSGSSLSLLGGTLSFWVLMRCSKGIGRKQPKSVMS
jgi:hypothetical protein